MPYIYSTLSADQEYCLYPKNIDPKSIVKADARIFVAGKANILNTKTFVTPKGVATVVGEEELDVLEQIPAFQRHMNAGYLTMDRKRQAIDKVVKDMTAKDASAQLVDSDFSADHQPKVNTGG